MFAIDTNILVYAHDLDSPFNKSAIEFLENILNLDIPTAGIPTQVFAEFLNLITRHTLKRHLTMMEAISRIQDYINAGTPIIHQKPTQLLTFLALAQSTTTRKKTFDLYLAATLKDNDIEGLYTANVDDFKEFTFLKVINPLKDAAE